MFRRAVGAGVVEEMDEGEGRNWEGKDGGVGNCGGPVQAAKPNAVGLRYAV